MTTTTTNQNSNQAQIPQQPTASSLINKIVHIKDHNGIPRPYIIKDEPRPGLLEIRLKYDKTFITHISDLSVYLKQGIFHCDRVISLRNLDNGFAIMGNGLHTLVG